MDSPVFFEKSGSGPAVILLHGFPMHQGVWQDFKKGLTNYTVYTPDLPGLGKSELPSNKFSLGDIAATMNSWIAAQGISDAVIIGHSLGGYIALEMVKQKPEFFRGLVLFHSTALPDSEEKKESRTKVLGFIEENGVLAFTSNFIQPLFANPQHTSIPVVKAITVQAGKEAVMGYTRAMRARNDTTSILRNFSGKILILGGDQDKGISIDSLQEQVINNPRARLYILADSGHMGMFEKPEECLDQIGRFLLELYGQRVAR